MMVLQDIWNITPKSSWVSVMTLLHDYERLTTSAFRFLTPYFQSKSSNALKNAPRFGAFSIYIAYLPLSGSFYSETGGVKEMLFVSQNRAEITATATKGHIKLHQLIHDALKLEAEQPDYAQCTDDGVTTLTFVFKSVEVATSVYAQTPRRRRR